MVDVVRRHGWLVESDCFRKGMHFLGAGSVQLGVQDEIKATIHAAS